LTEERSRTDPRIGERRDNPASAPAWQDDLHAYVAPIQDSRRLAQFV